MKKLISILLTFTMIFSVFATFVSAEEIANQITDGLTLTGMSSASVNQAVENYFDERADYLLGNTDAMDWLVVGIANDEAAHMAQYNAKGIVLNGTVFTIECVECYDTYAEVIAAETISYSQNGIAGTEEVIHELTLYLDSESVPVVAADGYMELCSDFVSCSYVAPAVQIFSNRTTAGSPLCIVEIAKAELGTAETGTNMTKYGEWYGRNGVAWCAIFVSWCANQANVSTSIITKTASCDTMMNAFKNQGNFYYSQNFGGSYTPQAGDILFVGTVTNDSTHVGIVEKVENGSVWIYDGNYSDKVNYHCYSLTATNIIGYGHPAYESSDHVFSEYESDTTGHWQECAICGYATEKEMHLEGATYSYDGTYHWKTCYACGVEMNKAMHILILNSDGTYKCKICPCRVFSVGVFKIEQCLEA